MRIDKFLKNSRIIKRRTVAKEACEKGMVKINDKLAKPSDIVKEDDILEIIYPNKVLKVKVMDLIDGAKKQDTISMYETIGE